MTLLGNIIWLICGGLFSSIAYMLGGALLCLTIIGIPFGWANIKLGVATLAPFGKTLRTDRDADGCVQTVLNVVWLVLFGWEIALIHLIFALLLAITIIGLPFARQHVKLVPISLFPFGRKLVPGSRSGLEPIS